MTAVIPLSNKLVDEIIAEIAEATNRADSERGIATSSAGNDTSEKGRSRPWPFFSGFHIIN